jgi:hypothetical protein
LTPLKHIFDLKNSSTSIYSKRKSSDINENNIDNDVDEPFFLKKLRRDKEDDYDFSSDEYESEKEN